MYLVGIDLGTTGCKSMLFDTQGKIYSQSYIEYELIREGNYIEQDADLWWDLVKKSLAECITAAEIVVDEIRALSISAQGISFVPIDPAGNTLGRAISWLDTRAKEEIEEIRRVFSDQEIFTRTGKHLSAAYTLPKLMWIKANKPELYAQTAKFLMGLDFITYKFTGKMLTDYSMASGTMAFNITTHQWDAGILAGCGIAPEKLPELNCAASFVGEIQPCVAQEVGLPKGVAVVLGAQDQKCAALGAGIKAGLATISLGTATAISVIADRPVLDPERRIPCFSLDKKHWFAEAVIPTSGIALKWLRNTFFPGLAYPQLAEIARKSRVGANGLRFYPHFEGAGTPYGQSDSKGFVYGLTLATAKDDLVRALMEGIAFQIKVNLELLSEISACPIEELRIFGGGAQSAFWCQVIADITGIPVSTLYTAEIANLGAAVLAGIGSGYYRDFAAAHREINVVERQYLPEPNVCAQYQQVATDYFKIQDKFLK